MKKTLLFLTRLTILLVSLSIQVSYAQTKPGPITACYVETTNYIESAGKYTLASTGENVFDIVIIFAANINYDDVAQKPVLGLNSGVVENLPMVSTLQNKGIKVLLSILGNHQGVGVCNFQSYDAAYDFAQQCKDVVDQYGLDGIDIDDEWSEYGTNGQPGVNDYSFVYFVTALRELMPDKILSFYYYGSATSRQSYNGVTVGSKLDYSWNAMYGTYNAPNVPGLTASQLAPAAVWINNTSTMTAASNATKTVNDGYGVYLTYALPDTDESSYISAFTQNLYGSSAVFDIGGGTVPDVATSPNPVNAETNVSVTNTLSWKGDLGAASHDVYFGTSNPPAFQGNQTGTTFNPGTLNTNTTYYWRIDEVNSHGTTTGSVWSFTTEAVATTNLAPDATASVSSEYSGDYSKAKMIDGNTATEWASNGEDTPWAKLEWSQGVTTSKIVLNERPNNGDHVTSGTLTFSNGGSISVGELPDNGAGKQINFSERTITWVKFQVDQGSGPNNGLSEFVVYGNYGGGTSTPPVAEFSANTTAVNEGGSVSFTDNSTNTPTAWSWTFDGGSPSSSTSQNPTVTYNTAGTYNVTLTATNADGSDTETKAGYITVNVVSTPPVAEFSANITTVDEGGSVSFTDNSTNTPTAWSWTFDGGSPSSSTSQSPTVTYNTAGTYNVTLTATNADGSDTETKTAYITVNVPGTTVVNLAPDATISVSSEYSSDYSKAKMVDGIIGQHGSGEWASDGEDTPWAQLDWSQGVVTSKIVLYDRPNEYDHVASGTLTFSDGSSVSVGSLPDDGAAETITFSERTITWVKLEVTSGDGPNNGLAEFEVFGYYGGTTPTPPVADFTANTTTVTEGGSVNFTDNSTNNPTSWSWTFDGGTPASSTSQTPTVTYNTAGTYNVTLTATNADGSDTETKTGYITVNAQSGGGDYAPFPYSTGFESGSVDSYWTLETENSYGRIQVTSANSPRGSYHLTSDVTTNSNFSTNSASLKIDLSGQTDVKLSFYWKEFNDEDHTEDGVFLSDNGGSTFTKVYNLTGGSTSYTLVELDIDQLASTNGLSLNGTFVIKFQQRDNYVIATDGIAWDDISVTEGDGGSSATNLALNKPATASSIYSAGYEAGNAVDGDVSSTRWASAVGSTEWIYVDLQDTYSISQVVLKWQAAYGKDFTIQVSDDASSWTTIKTVTNNSSLTNDLTGLSGTGRYVRMNGTAYGPYTLYSLWEFEVYGTSLKSAVNSAIKGEEANSLTEMKVYPNPATDVFTVESPEMSMTRLTIFDMQGRLVYQNEFEGRIQISTDEISGSGILFIKLASETNTYIQRIVVE